MITKEKADSLGLKTIDAEDIGKNEKNKIINKIKELIPNIINSDNVLNIEALKDILDISQTTSNNKGYELTFAGKGIAKALADTPTKSELKAKTKQSKNFDETQNVIIRGDNLEVLKILKQNYYEKIKMIYIDPPYNTGNDGFIYNDNFKENEQDLIDEFRLDEESINYLTSLYGTKTHSAWLSFIYPRLKLARDLLKEDGVIFISIDDNEQANLKILMDEIFGEENFVGEIIRKTKTMTGDEGTGFNFQHEYLVIYAKNKSNLFLQGEIKNYENYNNPDNDENGDWIPGDPSAKSGGEGTYFEIINPFTNNIDLPPKNRFWAFSRETLKEYIKRGKIKFKKEHKKGERGFIFKRYKNELISEYNSVNSLFALCNNYLNQIGTKEIRAIFEKECFSNPKPLNFIRKIIQYSTNPNDIILDFFAGSGTTAHAVMDLNAEDNGNRKFILVQIDEEVDKKTEAYKFCKDNRFEPVISSITIERVNRAGEKLKEKNENLDIGYKVFSLCEKPTIDENFSLIHPRESTNDKIYNMLVATNKPLTSKIVELEKDKLYQVENYIYVLDDFKASLDELKNYEIFIDAYSNISLEKYLNFGILNRDNIQIVY